MLAARDRISPGRFDTLLNSRLPLAAICLSTFFAMTLLVAAPASAAPPLAGTYRITENTDLGSEIRLTVQLNFFNPGDAAVAISRVSLRSLSAPGQLVSAASSVVVQSHSNSQCSLQFLIAKKDYNSWSIGPHQQFLVTLQLAGGKVTQISLPLLRTRE